VQLADENNGARSKRTSFDKFQLFHIAPVPKQALPAPQNNGMDHRPVLVDEVVVHQGMHQRATAGDQDVLTRLLLQPRNLLRDI
jgi:hypothetical protein